MPASLRSAPAEKILVRGVNWLGDAIMTIPAVQRLREARPDAHIVLATPEKIAALWENSHLVDSVISLARERSVVDVGRELKAHGFQISIIFPNSPRSALESFLGRIHCRVGYRAQWRRWLLTHPVEPEPGFVAMRKKSVEEIQQLVTGPARPAPIPTPEAHQMHHYLRLVATLGASTQPLAPEVRVTKIEVASFLEKFGISSGSDPGPKLFGMNPGAEYGPAKRWPWGRFAAAALQVHQETGGRWLIFGGKGDMEIAAHITQAITEGARSEKPAAVNLAGRTTLRELCAGLKACSVVLTNDTGPMHVAAAVGTRVVAIFGSTSSHLTGPGLPGGSEHFCLQTTVPCSPCFLPECPIDFRCMTHLDVETVVQTLLKAVRP